MDLKKQKPSNENKSGFSFYSEERLSLFQRVMIYLHKIEKILLL